MVAMVSLVLAAVFFIGIHVGVSATGLRARLIAKHGEIKYRGLFSLASGVGLAWLIVSFLQARTLAPTWLWDWRGVSVLLNFIALLLLSFAVMKRGPTAMGSEGQLAQAVAVTGMHRITRHPMLWGFVVWSATHMLYNPQWPALVFFGAFLVLALIGPRAIDAKRAAAFGESWQRYAAVTSNIPFQAIREGRNTFEPKELLDWPLFVAILLTELLVQFHGSLFGMPAI